MASNAELKEAMGQWLGALAPWEFFSTWTFSHPVHVNGAMYWSRRHTRMLAERAGLPLYGFVAAEAGNVGGLIHLHALLGNCGVLKSWCGNFLPKGVWGQDCCMLHMWPCGIARVLPYNPKLGATHYVAKYITKRLAEWEIFGDPLHSQGSFKAATMISIPNPSSEVHNAFFPYKENGR